MTNNKYSKFYFPAFLLLWLVIFALLAWYIIGVAKRNEAYDRYTSCVLSVPALERNEERIEQCYQAAIDDTGVKVKRYDTK